MFVILRVDHLSNRDLPYQAQQKVSKCAEQRGVLPEVRYSCDRKLTYVDESGVAGCAQKSKSSKKLYSRMPEMQIKLCSRMRQMCDYPAWYLH